MSKELIQWQVYGLDPHLALTILAQAGQTPLVDQLTLAALLKTRLFDRIIPAARKVGYKDIEGLYKRIKAARQKHEAELKELLQGNQVIDLFQRNFQDLKESRFQAKVVQKLLSQLQGSQSAALKRTLQYSRLKYEAGEYAYARRLSLCLQNAVVSNMFDDTCAQWGLILTGVVCGQEDYHQAALVQLQKQCLTFNQNIFFTQGEFMGANVGMLQAHLIYCMRGAHFEELLSLKPWLPFITAALPYFLRYFIVAQLLTDRLSVARKEPPYGNLEQFQYNDPFTVLLKLVAQDFDFKAAFAHVAVLEGAIDEDVHLRPRRDQLLQKIRELLFVLQLKLYSEIGLAQVETLCGLAGAQGEKWLMRVVRRAGVRAEIDPERGVVMQGGRSEGGAEAGLRRLREIRLRNHFTTSSE